MSSRHPCTICEHNDYCTFTEDGTLAKCMRVESPRASAKGGWIHQIRPEYKPILDDVKTLSNRPHPSVNVPDVVVKCYQHPKAAAMREDTATTLNVSVNSLERLGVGYGYDWNGVPFASFPSVNSDGIPIGIIRRYKDGGKKTMRGTSNAGVFAPDYWFDGGGPLFVVEGASDTAMLLTWGAKVLGRPSNISGAEIIAALARQWHPQDSPIIVVGENDLKLERQGQEQCRSKQCFGCAWCWPGKYGAERTKYLLRRHTQHVVGDIMPPPEYKDIREWATKSRQFALELVAAVGNIGIRCRAIYSRRCDDGAAYCQ